MAKKPLLGMLLVSFLALWGCLAPPPVQPKLLPTPSPSPLHIEPWPQPTPLAFPTPTPPATATATATAPPATPPSGPKPCVPANPKAALPSSLTFTAAMGGAVQQALDAGMPLQTLNQALQQAQLGNYPYAAVEGDFDGDHLTDAAVSLIDPHTKTKPPQGVLLVFLCRKGKFAAPLVFQEPVTDRAWGAPIIHFAQDLNADGRTELVVSSAHCDPTGAVCEERYAILGWRDGGLRDLLRDAAQPLPSPVSSVEDPDGDGIYDFIVETGNGQRLVWHYHEGFWQRQP